MVRLAALALMALTTAPLSAQTSAPARAAAQEVVVVVNVPVPAGLTRERVVGAMQATVPEYRRLPGLERKYYTLSGDGGFGGVYLFRSRAEAEAWFSDAWRAKVKATYGAPASVVYYDVPIVVQGPAAK